MMDDFTHSRDPGHLPPYVSQFNQATSTVSATIRGLCAAHEPIVDRRVAAVRQIFSPV